jgi:hypothetical protein
VETEGCRKGWLVERRVGWFWGVARKGDETWFLVESVNAGKRRKREDS